MIFILAITKVINASDPYQFVSIIAVRKAPGHFAP